MIALPRCLLAPGALPQIRSLFLKAPFWGQKWASKR